MSNYLLIGVAVLVVAGALTGVGYWSQSQNHNQTIMPQPIVPQPNQPAEPTKPNQPTQPVQPTPANQTITWSINGPMGLGVGKEAAWRVQAKLPSGEFVLAKNLEVFWGDQLAEADQRRWEAAGGSTAPDDPVAWFEHSFAAPGTYTITFRAKVAGQEYLQTAQVNIAVDFPDDASAKQVSAVSWEVSGPSALAVGEVGTWQIRAKLSTGQFVPTGGLRASWGDQPAGAPPVWEQAFDFAMGRPEAPILFRHTFVLAGNYNVTFRAEVYAQEFTNSVIIAVK